MRFARAALAGLLLVGFLVLALLWWRIDAIAARRIEREGTSALGVRTSVGAVLLRPLAGALALTSLAIANPSGYEGAFLELGSGRIDVELGTLLEETIVVPRIELRDVDVVLERRLRQSNYGAILEHLAQGGGGAAPPPDAGAEAGRRLVVRELVIRDVDARVRLAAARGVGREIAVKIPEIRLRDVGAGGVRTGQLVGIAVKAILAAVATRAPGLPVDVARSLDAALGGAGRIPLEVAGKVLVETGDVAGGIAEELLQDPKRAVDDTAEALKGAGEKGARAAQETLRGLGGLLGGDEQEDKR